MSGLAELLHSSGVGVTGSDLHENQQTRRLKSLGLVIFKGHKKNHIGPANIVIYSSAIPSDNIEIKTAKNLHLPVMSRSQALSEVMRLKRGLVVAGTHGKTTTTSLLAHIFIHNRQDPTVMIGGRPLTMKSTARIGKGKWFIAESDESDGGFQHLFPEVAVITNIDKDHEEHYGGFKKLKEAFFEFASKIPFYGRIIACGDQKLLKEMLKPLSGKVIFYGFKKTNHFVLEKTKSSRYQVFFNKKNLGFLNPPLYGDMNGLNTLAAIATSISTGMSFSSCVKALKNFKGVQRRMQKTGQAKGITFYDDYAHHPTEIRAVLSAFREQCGKKNLVVLFQPHRFSRTAQCWNNFLTCFQPAHKVFLTDIYPAGESPLRHINSRTLAQKIQHAHCHYVQKNIPRTLLKNLKKGDVFITMGAGNVDRYGTQILKILKKPL